MTNNKYLGLIQKALYIWMKQYHGFIPLPMMKRYINKFLTERKAIKTYGKRYFDPTDTQDYNAWLSLLPKHSTTNFSNLVTTIHLTDTIDTSLVSTPYTAITSSNITLYNTYLPSVTHDIFYFDSDTITNNIRSNPHLKPDYSPNLLESYNYIGDYFIVKTSLLSKYNHQSLTPYELLLELSKVTSDFCHIPLITYGSSTSYKIPTIQSHTLKSSPLVSIIIPTKDKIEVLDTCIQSIIAKTSYQNYEIIIVDNDSIEQITHDYFQQITSILKNVFVHKVSGPFNFSYINNEAVKVSHGEYLVFLNNDTSIISSNWLEEMIYYASKNIMALLV